MVIRASSPSVCMVAMLGMGLVGSSLFGHYFQANGAATLPQQTPTGTDEASVQARLVDDTGRVLGSSIVALTVWTQDALGITTDRQTLTTDSLGQLELRLGPDASGMSDILFVAKNGNLAAKRRGVRVSPGGSTSLGDVAMRLPPMVASGVITDDSGRPIEGAKIQVYEQLKDESIAASPSYRLAFAYPNVSDSTGAFELRGLLDSPTIRILPESRGFRTEPIDCSAGSQHLQIIMSKACAIQGRLLLDEGVSPRLISIRILAHGRPDAIQGLKDLIYTQEDGSFACYDQYPGVYTVEIAAGDDVLLSIPNFSVGLSEDDQRLHSIDLRGKVRVIVLQLMAENARSGLAGVATYSPTGNPDSSTVMGFRESLLNIPTPLDSIDVRLFVQGYRLEHIQGLSSSRKVVLRPGIPIWLILTEQAILPKAPLFLGATLRSEEGNSWGTASVVFDASKKIQCVVSQAGYMNVEWFLERRKAGVCTREALSKARDQRVFVADDGAQQTLELELEGEEWRRW